MLIIKCVNNNSNIVIYILKYKKCNNIKELNLRNQFNFYLALFFSICVTSDNLKSIIGFIATICY